MSISKRTWIIVIGIVGAILFWMYVLNYPGGNEVETANGATVEKRDGCNSPSVKKTFDQPIGWDLGWSKLEIRYCFTGSRVRDGAAGFHDYRVTDWGNWNQWDITFHDKRCYYENQHYKFKCETLVRFKQVALGWNAQQQYIRINLAVYGNGTANIQLAASGGGGGGSW